VGVGASDLAQKLDRYFSVGHRKWHLNRLHRKTISLPGRFKQCSGLAGRNIDNMIVASADLSNSDKTDGFLKNTKALPGVTLVRIPAGRWLPNSLWQPLPMVLRCMGSNCSLRNFFVFSDYMKPAVRLAALMDYR